MRKLVRAGILAVLGSIVRRLSDRSAEDESEVLGPARIEFDWEGDISDCKPATTKPEERFAVHSTLMHERLINGGFEERGRG